MGRFVFFDSPDFTPKVNEYESSCAATLFAAVAAVVVVVVVVVGVLINLYGA